MTDLPEERRPPDSPEVTPRRPGRSVMQFVGGVLMGVVVVVFLQCVLVAKAMNYNSHWRHSPFVLAFWVDVALLLLLGGLAIRARGKAFRNGLMAGSALALLLSAACWGSSGLSF